MLAGTTAFTDVENEIPTVSNLVNTDCNTKPISQS